MSSSIQVSRMSVMAALGVAALTVLMLSPGLMVATGGLREDDVQITEATAEGPSHWFIQLSRAPVAEATASPEAALAAVSGEQNSFRRAMASAGITYRERYAFKHLWNGISAEVDGRSIPAVRLLPGVTAVFPVMTIEAPDPPTAVDPGEENLPLLITALQMTNATLVHAAGNTGAGIKLAIMDTGVDYNHPDLGGCFGAGCHIAGGFDLVGDNYNASGTGAALIPVPDPDPQDCNGHGTHVTGIAAANGNIKGVAPDAEVRMYRVFGCTGSTSADVMLMAMEMSYLDGNQILNMSIGSARQWPQYPTAVASDNLVKKGMVVVASAGNDGSIGLYASSAPALGQRVISVASVTNTATNLVAFTLVPGGTLVGYVPMTGDPPPPPTMGTYPIANAGDGCVGPLPDMTGHIALMMRGTCSFRTKAQNAQAANAVGAVIWNNVAGTLSGTLGTSPLPAVMIPTVGISMTDGQAIVTALMGGPVSLDWTPQFLSTPGTSGHIISSFSSYGPSPDLALKPDMSAPGGTILSTIRNAPGGGLYGLNSGTSMAAPHVAGAAALLLKSNSKLTPANVQTILMNSAVPRLWFGNPGLGFPELTHRQGAGELDIYAAINGQKVLVGPAKLALGETEGMTITRNIEVWNRSDQAANFDLSHVAAVASGPNTFTPTFFSAPAAVNFPNGPSVSVPAKSFVNVPVEITENPGLPDRSVFGGYIVLTPTGGGREYRVPYSAFKGDYQSILYLNPAASSGGNPQLRATFSFGPSENVTLDYSVNPGPFFAYINFHIDHPARMVLFEAVHQGTGKVNKIGEINFLGRNSAASSFYVLTWDGRDFRGNFVNSGNYHIRLTVLKALGNAANPAHVEQWVSPTEVTLIR